jgi:hypothetical protein
MGKGRGRPGGNPDITKYSYKIQDAGREEAFDKVITFKTTDTQAAQIKALGKKKGEFLRNAVEKALKEIPCFSR